MSRPNVPGLPPKKDDTINLSRPLNFLYTRIFGETQYPEEPDKVWLEERTNFNKRAIVNDPDWKEGKTLYEQIEMILDQKAMPFRTWDCCSICCYGDSFGEKFFNSLLVPVSLAVPCLTYGLAEQKLGLSPDPIIPCLKCALCIPCCSCCWMVSNLRTLNRELHEVRANRYYEFILTCCCFWNPLGSQLLTLNTYMNATKVNPEWWPQETQGDYDPLAIQKQFLEDWDEELKLD